MPSQKHYEAIAGIILRRFGVDEPWRKQDEVDWAIRLFVGELEDFLAADNPRFDRERFREACGF